VKVLWGVWAASTGLGVTMPGPDVSIPVAFGAELFMTFSLIFLILLMLSYPRISRYTGVAAGALVVLLVYFGASISGTGINPARSLAPAVLTGSYHELWLYLVAPLVGSSLAVAAFRVMGPFQSCAKLFHATDVRCIFCQHQTVPASEPRLRGEDL